MCITIRQKNIVKQTLYYNEFTIVWGLNTAICVIQGSPISLWFILGKTKTAYSLR